MAKQRRVDLACDHIEDKDLYKAVVFAIVMIRGGTPPSIATARAATYYNRQTSSVAFYVGQHAGRLGSAKRNYRKGRDDGP